MKAIKTKPINATNKSPIRIQAQDKDGNKIQIPFEELLSEKANHLIAAERFSKHMGWIGKFVGAYISNSEMYWVLCCDDNEHSFTVK